jgi:hypothetical protein
MITPYPSFLTTQAESYCHSEAAAEESFIPVMLRVYFNSTNVNLQVRTCLNTANFLSDHVYCRPDFGYSFKCILLACIFYIIFFYLYNSIAIPWKVYLSLY